MSALRTVVTGFQGCPHIVCDQGDCTRGTFGQRGQGARALRLQLAREGWTSLPNKYKRGDVRDYCPAHSADQVPFGYTQAQADAAFEDGAWL